MIRRFVCRLLGHPQFEWVWVSVMVSHGHWAGWWAWTCPRCGEQCQEFVKGKLG